MKTIFIAVLFLLIMLSVSFASLDIVMNDVSGSVAGQGNESIVVTQEMIGNAKSRDRIIYVSFASRYNECMNFVFPERAGLLKKNLVEAKKASTQTLLSRCKSSGNDNAGADFTDIIGALSRVSRYLESYEGSGKTRIHLYSDGLDTKNLKMTWGKISSKRASAAFIEQARRFPIDLSGAQVTFHFIPGTQNSLSLYDQEIARKNIHDVWKRIIENAGAKFIYKSDN